MLFSKKVLVAFTSATALTFAFGCAAMADCEKCEVKNQPAHGNDASGKDISQQKANADKDIVDIAASNDAFSTLVAAIQAAELVDVLKSDGPFTVLAPTNEAFAKLPDGTLETLLDPANRDQLAQILTYHVIPGKVMATDVVELDEAKTAEGSMVTIRTYGDNVRINNANVTATDIEASNGVIHVIDQVLLPKK